MTFFHTRTWSRCTAPINSTGQNSRLLSFRRLSSLPLSSPGPMDLPGEKISKVCHGMPAHKKRQVKAGITWYYYLLLYLKSFSLRDEGTTFTYIYNTMHAQHLLTLGFALRSRLVSKNQDLRGKQCFNLRLFRCEIW